LYELDTTKAEEFNIFQDYLCEVRTLDFGLRDEMVTHREEGRETDARFFAGIIEEINPGIQSKLNAIHAMHDQILDGNVDTADIKTQIALLADYREQVHRTFASWKAI
jgi:hypothetical protein